MFSIRSASIARAIVPRVGRAYATASTRPPVQLFGVDGTYASALVCSPLPLHAITIETFSHLSNHKPQDVYVYTDFTTLTTTWKVLMIDLS